MVYTLTKRTFFPVLRRFVSSVSGLKNLPKNNSFIIATNHISQVDPLLIIATLFPYYKKKIHFIAERGEYGTLFEKIVARKWAGCILINRQKPTSCIDEGIAALKQGKIVGIFPEGWRVEQSNWLFKGKTGVIRMALNARVPILPIGVITRGEPHRRKKKSKRLYSHPYDAFKLFVLQKQRTRLAIGKLTNFEYYYNKPITYALLRQLTDEVMKKIAVLCKKKYPY